MEGEETGPNYSGVIEESSLEESDTPEIVEVMLLEAENNTECDHVEVCALHVMSLVPVHGS